MPILKRSAFLVVLLATLPGISQVAAPRPRFDAFEVATIKQVDSTPHSGRFIKMQTPNRFVSKDYTLKLLLAAAYDLNPKTVLGGPGWIDSEHFDIQAITPGTVQPTHDEQMTMLRSLLNERFHLTFHRAPKEYSIYALEIAKNGPNLKPSAEPRDAPAVLGPAVVYPDRVALTARNATLTGLTSLLQRAVLDRPVIDRTGLPGRFDFNLDWAPDETEFGGALPPASATTPSLPLFQAIEQQLGLRLKATRGEVPTLVVDRAEQPSSD